MTDAQFRQRLDEAAEQVRKWPLWKQNILQDSLSPTVPVPRTPVDNSWPDRDTLRGALSYLYSQIAQAEECEAVLIRSPTLRDAMNHAEKLLEGSR